MTNGKRIGASDSDNTCNGSSVGMIYTSPNICHAQHSTACVAVLPHTSQHDDLGKCPRGCRLQSEFVGPSLSAYAQCRVFGNLGVWSSFASVLRNGNTLLVRLRVHTPRLASRSLAGAPVESNRNHPLDPILITLHVPTIRAQWQATTTLSVRSMATSPKRARLISEDDGVTAAHVCQLCNKGYERADHLQRHLDSRRSMQLSTRQSAHTKGFRSQRKDVSLFRLPSSFQSQRSPTSTSGYARKKCRKRPYWS